MQHYSLTTQRALRAAFWQEHPQYQRHGRRTQNDYPADIRTAWVDFIDACFRNGRISQRLVNNATL